MDSICPRCGAPLQFSDYGSPVFCSQCGLPQLRVSEEALSAAPGTEQNSLPGPLDWRRAFRSILPAALVGVAIPALLPGALASGGIAGLALLSLPVLTVAAVYRYARPRRAVSTSAGAHIGAVLGLLIGALVAFVTGVAGFVLRYGYHSRAMDQVISQAIGQMPAQITAQMASAGPPPPELLAFIASPEFRAGSFLFGHVFWLLLLTAVGSVCGWVAATVLRKRRAGDAG